MVEILGQQYNVGKKPIILYTYNNHHKGTPKQRQANYTLLAEGKECGIITYAAQVLQICIFVNMK